MIFKENDIVIVNENTGNEKDNWKAKIISFSVSKEVAFVKDIDNNSDYRGQVFCRRINFLRKEKEKK